MVIVESTDVIHFGERLTAGRVDRLEGYLDVWARKGAPDHVWMEHIFPAMGELKRINGADWQSVGAGFGLRITALGRTGNELIVGGDSLSCSSGEGGVATWNGVVSDGELRYGHAGHPDYFSKPVSGYPVVSVAEDKLQLHLTT